MWRRMVLAMTIACCCGLCGSQAQVVGDQNVPSFNIEEQRIIQRNALLANRLQRDPWLVRHALDVLASELAIATRSADALTTDPGTSKQLAGKQGKRRSNPGAVPDPKHNPDLAELDRASPEAAHDLFKLIQQVKPVKLLPKR